MGPNNSHSGSDDNDKKHTKKTPSPDEKTTPFDWDAMVQQYSTAGSELTNTPNWNDLISQIMVQMGSTTAGGMYWGRMAYVMLNDVGE